MIYQFEHEEINTCRECPCHSFVDVPCDDDEGWCDLQDASISSNSRPQENDCPLVAISKTETVGCFYCRGIEAHGIVAVKTVIDEYLTEIFCPNCGRKL